MDKYLIAINFKDFDTCLDEAESMQKTLRSKGITAKYTVRRNLDCVRLDTERGTVEFITHKTLMNEGFTVGKRYDKVFYINPVCPQFNKRVKESIYATNYLDWILDKEHCCESSKFKNLNLRCANCKNLPICAIKEEYFTIQTAIWDALNTSEHFTKAELSCEYFAPKDPIFPCGCV